MLAACALSSPTTCTRSSRKCSTSLAGWRKSRLEPAVNRRFYFSIYVCKCLRLCVQGAVCVCVCVRARRGRNGCVCQGLDCVCAGCLFGYTGARLCMCVGACLCVRLCVYACACLCSQGKGCALNSKVYSKSSKNALSNLPVREYWQASGWSWE